MAELDIKKKKMLPQSPPQQKSEPLEFWFNADPRVPIPTLTVYEIKKKHGQIAADMTYKDFLKTYDANIFDPSK